MNRTCRLLSFLFFFFAVRAAWLPAPSLNTLSPLICAGVQASFPSPIFILLTAPPNTTVTGLAAFLFVSDDGTAWQTVLAAARAATGAPLPSVPEPNSLTWLPAGLSVFASSSAPTLGPAAFFTSWTGNLTPSASFASHAVVYVVPLAAGLSLSSKPEEIAAAALGGGVVERISPPPAACSLSSQQSAVANSTASEEAIVNEKLAALPPAPVPPTPSPSRVPKEGANSLQISGSAARATALAALTIAAAGLTVATLLL